MTTFLVTAWTPEDKPEEYTTPYCSWACLDADNPHDLRDQWNDERYSYEFDETCANCGKLVPAAEASIAELMYANDVLMEGFVILRPEPILYDLTSPAVQGNGTTGDEQ